MPMKNFPLLQILQDGATHSGEKLAQQLGVTRSAIWKSIQQLQAAGIIIRSQARKGYCLESSIELLNEKEILAEVKAENRSTLKDLALLDTISSTNDYALTSAREECALPLACFAEQQTQGRGRGGRKWVSPYGNNVYFSLAWHFDKDPSELIGLSLVAGIIILNTLKRYGFNDEFWLKWPNDVLWRDRKLAGILVEVIAQSHQSCKLILGIGINTLLSANTEIDQPWASLAEIGQSKIRRNRLCGILLDESISCFKDIEINGLASYVKLWREFDYCKNQALIFKQAQQIIHGVAQGIGDQGELLLLNEQGQLRKLMSGEITELRAVKSASKVLSSS